MVANIFKVTLAASTLFASGCAKTDTTAVVEKTAGALAANAQATENERTARGGNIVALDDHEGKEYMVGPKGDALVRIKLTTEDTGGAYEVITEDHPKGFESEPHIHPCLLYTSPSPRDQRGSRMPSSA